MRIVSNRTDQMIDECFTAMVEKGRTVDDCLALYPEQGEALEQPLRLAVKLRALHAVQASPEFRAASPARLRSLAAAAVPSRRNGKTPPSLWAYLGLRRSHPSPLAGSRARPALWLQAACLALIGVILTGLGTIRASAQSLPGDFLYPVKLAQESFQLTFAANQADAARLHLDFAGRRLDELTHLFKMNRTTGLDQALDNYNDQVQAELDFLSQESELSTSEQSSLAQSVLSNIPDHQARLASLTQGAPASAKDSLASALAVSQQAYSRAEEIVLNQNNGSSGGPGLTPGSGLTATPVPPAKATPTPVLPNAAGHGTPQPTPTRSPATPSTGSSSGGLAPTSELTPNPRGTTTPDATHGAIASPPGVKPTILPGTTQTWAPPNTSGGTLAAARPTATPTRTGAPATGNLITPTKKPSP